MANNIYSGELGFNIIGFATANLGFGVALRNTALILKKQSIPFGILDIDPGGNRTGHDMSLQKYSLSANEKLPYVINLFFMNPPIIEMLFRDLPNLVTVKDKLNVGLCFWELPNLPPSWVPILNQMDLVLAPSLFIQRAMVASPLKTLVTHCPQALPAVPDAIKNRERWGMQKGRVIFVFSFDISSGVQKKNPLAVIEAFKLAFPNDEADLIVKINNRNIAPEAGLVVDQIKAITAAISTVRIIDEVMDYSDVLSLYASADVFVSLHRGEGLGLGLMECMALGKPVIATAWSGNMDFMTKENSCLVDYELIPVDPRTQYYQASDGVNQIWAEPDLFQAIDWMRRLAYSENLRKKIGAQAEESMANRISIVGLGKVYSDILNKI